MPEYRVDFGLAIASSGCFGIYSDAEKVDRRVDYSFDDYRLAGLAVGNVPAPVLDVVEVLRGLTLIDRYARRTLPGDTRPIEQRGPRRFIATFPVRDVSLWSTTAAASLLERLVWYLGCDVLEASFVPVRERTRAYEVQQRLPLDVPAPFDAVTLLSGGLDSVFGLLSCVGFDKAKQTLAVSVDSHHRQVGLQTSIVRALRLRRPYGAWELPVVHIPLRSRVRRDLKMRESSYRMRVLGFLAAGLLASVGVGLDRLVVAENGPGALNLPGTPTLGGSRLNRAMHPTTLNLVAELVSVVLGTPFRIENVGLSLTKRQMVNRMTEAGFRPLLDLTNSCDRFPYAVADKHCGVCSSCLLRALAALDNSSIFDRLGFEGASVPVRLSTMARSAAFVHLRMVGELLDDVLASKTPIDRLWAWDPDIYQVRKEIPLSDLLVMLRAFRQDISDLAGLVDLVQSGGVLDTVQGLARLKTSY